jgi:hypothetical protein
MEFVAVEPDAAKVILLLPVTPHNGYHGVFTYETPK